jgi:DNA-binding beta-propeller fold protein YncE
LAISSTAISVTSATVIASGYSVAPNMAALILGPTGLAYDAETDILYVASTNDNEIFAVPQAGRRMASSGTGAVIFRDPHLRGPLALVFAPNGDLLTANGDATPNADATQPSEIVEFTKKGKFVTQFNVDASQGGAFGIAVANVSRGVVRFVFIDDVANDMTVFDRSAQPDEARRASCRAPREAGKKYQALLCGGCHRSRCCIRSMGAEKGADMAHREQNLDWYILRTRRAI